MIGQIIRLTTDLTYVDGGKGLKEGMILPVIPPPTGQARNGERGFWVMGDKPVLVLHRECELVNKGEKR